MESESGNAVNGASGFDPAWLTEALLLVDVVECVVGVDEVVGLGTNDDAVFCTVCVTFWTTCCTGLVVAVVLC